MSPQRRVLVIGWAVILVVAGAVCLLNVLGFSQGGRGQVGDHLVYEGSSWLAIALLAWTPWVVWQVTKTWPLAGQVLAHAASALAFAVAHISLFILFRAAVFAALGQPYSPAAALADFRYEVWKDLLAYGLFTGAYVMIGRLGRSTIRERVGEDNFDIRDGARLVRTPLSDILAVTSAGNYAEFRLRDGRRPLMRTSLTALEMQLGARGFVRSHRSWLVNARAVRGLSPEGSGDYRIEMDGFEAPLSRRYPEALKRLREPAD